MAVRVVKGFWQKDSTFELLEVSIHLYSLEAYHIRCVCGHMGILAFICCTLTKYHSKQSTCTYWETWNAFTLPSMEWPIGLTLA